MDIRSAFVECPADNRVDEPYHRTAFVHAGDAQGAAFVSPPPRAVPASLYELGDFLVDAEHAILELLYVLLERDYGPDGAPGEGLEVVKGEDVRGVAHGEHEPAVLDL